MNMDSFSHFALMKTVQFQWEKLYIFGILLNLHLQSSSVECFFFLQLLCFYLYFYFWNDGFYKSPFYFINYYDESAFLSIKILRES